MKPVVVSHGLYYAGFRSEGNSFVHPISSTIHSQMTKLRIVTYNNIRAMFKDTAQ